MSEFVLDDRETPRFRVNRRVMVDPAVWEAEQARVLDTSWLYVGHESEIPKPHDFRTRRVAGRPVIFTRDAEQAVRVFINSCTHRGALLCRQAEGNGRFLKCFYHAWSFDTSGSLVAMPDDESYGPSFDRANLGLVSPAQLSSYRGFVFISFSRDVPPLETYLAGAREYIDLVSDQSEVAMQVLAGSHEYSMRANWKLLVENSFDGYHGLTVHQRYFDMLSAAGKQRSTGPTVKRGYDLGNGHAITAGPAAELFRPMPTESAQQKYDDRRQALLARYPADWVNRMYGSRNMLIFPNLILIDHVMGIVIRKIDPVGPGYTEITSWQLAPPGEDPELQRIRHDNYLSFWGPAGLATPDDVEALEACQLGFAAHQELPWSDISRGMVRDEPLGTDELQMRTFWRRWNELVTGEHLPIERAPAVPAARR